MTDESLVGKAIKLPGIVDVVTVLSLSTCSESGCTKDVVVIHPANADKPYRVHLDGHRVIGELPASEPDDPPQTAANKTGGGKHHAVQ